MRAPRLRPWGCLLSAVLTYLSVIGGAVAGAMLGRMIADENGFWLGAVIGGILALSSVSKHPPWGNIVTKDGPRN